MTDGLIFGLKIAAVVLISYLCGTIGWAEIISKCKGKNIRELGSGNPGTMNMLRNYGIKLAILTLVLDALKGAVPVIASYYLMQIGPSFGSGITVTAPAWLGYYSVGVGKLTMAVSGLSAVVGHVFPVFKKFRGGKGVATGIGVFMAFNPVLALIAFVASLLYLLFCKYGCIASFINILSMTVVEVVLACVYRDHPAVIACVLLIAALIVWAHRGNIVRLMKGTESDANLIRRYRASKLRKAEAAAQATGAEVSANPPETAEASTKASQSIGDSQSCGAAVSDGADGQDDRS